MKPFDAIKPDDLPEEAEELTEERTPRTKTFDLKDGNHRTIGHIGLLHAPDGNGGMVDVDLSAGDMGDRFVIDTGYYTAEIFKDPLLVEYTNGRGETVTFAPDFGDGLNPENPPNSPEVRFRGTDIYGADARIAPAKLDLVSIIGRDNQPQTVRDQAPISFRYTYEQPPGFSSDLTVEDGGQDSDGRRARVRASEVNRRTITTRSESREEITVEYEVTGEAREFDEQRNPVWKQASYPVEVRT